MLPIIGNSRAWFKLLAIFSDTYSLDKLRLNGGLQVLLVAVIVECGFFVCARAVLRDLEYTFVVLHAVQLKDIRV